MRKTLFFFIATFVVAFLTVSCDHDKHIISSGEMEDILYDYHLADAMASQSRDNQGANQIAYRAAVLKKYGVTQAQFDSSMVYYMRHTDDLHTIYEHISDRMQNDARDMGSTTTSSISLAGDSTDIWKLDPSIILMPNEPFNLYNFRFVADSTFHKGDVITFLFRSNFIFQDGMRDGVAMIAVTFKNDSVASSLTHVSGSQAMSISVKDDKQLGIKDIRGFLLLNRNNMANSSSTTLQLAAFYDLHLLRIHQKPQKEKPKPAAEGAIPDDSTRRMHSATDPNPLPEPSDVAPLPDRPKMRPME